MLEGSLRTSEIRGPSAYKVASNTNRPSIADSDLSFEISAMDDHN